MSRTARALGAFAALCAIVWVAVWAWARTPSWVPLSSSERGETMRALRAALDHAPAEKPKLARAISGPLMVTLYDRGEAIDRVSAKGATLGEAVALAAAQLGALTLDTDARSRARIKVDLVTARAPIATLKPLFQLALCPGVDGLGLDFGTREFLLLPDDLIHDDLVSARAPVPAMEFTIGVDPRALERLSRMAGATRESWRATPHRYFRFRTDGFIEPAAHAGPPLATYRGQVAGPALTRDHLRAAAIAGGAYLLRHLGPDGQFDYEYYTADDLVSRSGYSIPRHAGAIYFLAQLYGATHDPKFLDGARRALGFLQAETPPGCDGPELACVGLHEDWEVDLGSSALTLLALAEYQRASGDARYQPWAERLVRFILFMQKPDGDFCHLYRPVEKRKNEHAKLLYYSGEAAYALAKWMLLPGPPSAPWRAPEISRALDRGLDFLTGQQYATLAGQFFFLEDHWTCMAADAGWDHLPAASRARYSDFCDQFVAFLRRTQFGADESITRAQPDFLGAYGFSPFLPPHATPVGSRSETAISTYAMARRRGEPDSKTAPIRAQIAAGLRFLLQHQISDDSAYLMASPESARGGLLMSDVKRYVRIDFVQHSCSAMLRAMDLF
ncbi:MAG TPA: hypothetical protein VII38_09390 [Polyangia bacterium]